MTTWLKMPTDREIKGKSLKEMMIWLKMPTFGVVKGETARKMMIWFKKPTVRGVNWGTPLGNDDMINNGYC